MIPAGFKQMGEVDGWGMYQAQFQTMLVPLAGFSPVTFTVTLAQKGEEIAAHLGDSLGLNFPTAAIPAKEFQEKWKNFSIKMTQQP